MKENNVERQFQFFIKKTMFISEEKCPSEDDMLIASPSYIPFINIKISSSYYFTKRFASCNLIPYVILEKYLCTKVIQHVDVMLVCIASYYVVLRIIGMLEWE